MTKSLVLIVTYSMFGLMYGQSATDVELLTRLNANRSQFSQWDNGPDLLLQVQKSNSDAARDLYVNEAPMICSDCPKPDPSNHPAVRRAAVSSDLIVLARVVKNTSALTQKNSFVFTDSQMSVDQVWKAEGPYKEPQAVIRGSEITVAAPGGVVNAGSHTIRASLSNRVDLKIGHTYLLFLRYVPESGSYVPDSLHGFDVSGSTVVPLHTGDSSVLNEYLGSPTVFLDMMKRSSDRALGSERAK